MLVSSILLVPLVPIAVIIFGYAIGGSYEQVLGFFSHPVAAIATAIAMVVIILHLNHEAHEAIEDYMHGVAEKLALIASTALSYTMITAGLFALIKLAL
jgi:succinate dehydrogenase / fumarate reductase membrane anchor subunit